MARKKSEQKWTIRKKALNNKSRKGDYVYIRETGKRGSYYKLKGTNFNIEDYLIKYGQGKKRTPTQRVSKKPRNITPKQREKSLNKLIGKGVWTTQLKGAYNTTPEQVRTSYKELLRKAVLFKDEEMLNILTQQSNIEKIKHRFEFRVNILDSEGSSLVNLIHLGNKDMEQVINEVKQMFKKGQAIEYDKGVAKSKGYTFNLLNKGVAHSFDIKLVMRKSR